MNLSLSLVCVLGATLPPLALGSAPQGQLVRVEPREAASSVQIEEWKQKLSSKDLDLREQAFGSVVGAARRDRALREALEAWARDESAGELAWTARLALREARSQDETQGMPRGRRGVFFFEPFEQDFDFDELRRQMFEDMDRGWRGFGGAAPVPQPPSGGMQSQSESVTLESGPDGVKCKVMRTENGQTTTEEYSAKSIDLLLEAHPELRGKIGGGSRAPGAAPQRQGWPIEPPQTTRGAPAIRTDILGVAIVPLAAEEATALGLEPGVGLRVERVEPGTIAQQLGLQRGHVLVEMNGKPLRNRDDIRSELRARTGDSSLEVILIDRWGQRRSRSWKPESAKQV
jgi:hypothetical protein